MKKVEIKFVKESTVKGYYLAEVRYIQANGYVSGFGYETFNERELWQTTKWYQSRKVEVEVIREVEMPF